MKNDISKLRDEVQQISLSQKVSKVKIDDLKKGVEDKINGVEDNMNGVEVKMHGMEAKMDGMEANMNGIDTKMDGMEEKLKGDMEDLKIDLTKLLQEMLTNGERVVKETHDESKRNFNHDFIDSNIGLKTHHVSMIQVDHRILSKTSKSLKRSKPSHEGNLQKACKTLSGGEKHREKVKTELSMESIVNEQ